MRKFRRAWGAIPLALLALIIAALSATWILWRSGPLSNTAQKKFDIVLVLGTPCLRDGSSSPEQRARVLQGVREWRLGVAPRIVMSGAAAHNQWVEADCMARLAEQQGVPAGDILEDRQAHDTIQNVFYTVAIMQAHGWKSADVVSSWSHLPRAALILAHFPIAWRTDAAPWPNEFGILDKSVRDWNEAQYCLRLRREGFHPSRFISR
ncbi:MAG: YdcF family protein [Silvibacterium sp.]